MNQGNERSFAVIKTSSGFIEIHIPEEYQPNLKKLNLCIELEANVILGRY
jgi:hypothetical protein